MTDGVDASKRRDQHPSRQAALDLTRRESGGEELRAADTPVLTSRERSDRLLRANLVGSTTHMVVKATTFGSSPPLAPPRGQPSAISSAAASRSSGRPAIRWPGTTSSGWTSTCATSASEMNAQWPTSARAGSGCPRANRSYVLTVRSSPPAGSSKNPAAGTLRAASRIASACPSSTGSATRRTSRRRPPAHPESGPGEAPPGHRRLVLVETQ